MYEDSYFPTKLVGKGQFILVELCAAIEQQQPETLAELYQLTYTATARFNDLQEEFWAAVPAKKWHAKYFLDCLLGLPTAAKRARLAPQQ
jgi:hypothetical protein